MKVVKKGMIQSVDMDEFLLGIKTITDEMQKDNQEAEVQYSPLVLPNGEIIYNALILGRK